ncbi:MAG: SDR family oxidoreductase [Proteobacteria bacterium]|nr:SDR family oxidoreductase [Pseudomonadota bacterium]
MRRRPTATEHRRLRTTRKHRRRPRYPQVSATALPLANQTAIVTGAAQSIGLAIAQRLATAGARVIVADRQPPPATENFIYQPCDVSDESSVQQLMTLAGEHGGLDILVNNAGIGLETPLAETTLADWEQLMAVNVRGVFLCAKHALPVMRLTGRGSIINIGSIEGNGANPLHAAYAASKGAVHALTRNIALEYGSANIRCNAIAPGWIETPFNEQLINQYPDADATRAAIKQLHPLRQLGSVEDIANLAFFLASADSAFANGQIYVLDGGRTACLPLPPL